MPYGGFSQKHLDVAQRWQEQRALEEMIADVRQDHVDAVLMGMGTPVVQACVFREQCASWQLWRRCRAGSGPRGSGRQRPGENEALYATAYGSATGKCFGCRGVTGWWGGE